MVNAAVWAHVAERQRRVLVESHLFAIDGRLERVEGVQHLIVDRMENVDMLLAGVVARSRDWTEYELTKPSGETKTWEGPHASVVF